MLEKEINKRNVSSGVENSECVKCVFISYCFSSFVGERSVVLPTFRSWKSGSHRQGGSVCVCVLYLGPSGGIHKDIMFLCIIVCLLSHLEKSSFLVANHLIYFFLLFDIRVSGMENSLFYYDLYIISCAICTWLLNVYRCYFHLFTVNIIL